MDSLQPRMCAPRHCKIKSNRAKALLVLAGKEWEDDRMVRLQDKFQRFTLNCHEFSAGQRQRARLNHLGVCGWLTFG